MEIVAWALVFHLAGMVFWLGGLFMAVSAARPALSVAGSTASGPSAVERARLARKGLRSLAHPGAAIMVLSGASLIYLLPGVETAGWLQAKLTLVVVLIAVDLVLTFRLRRMPERELSAGQLAMFRGAIVVLFLLILILAVVKPF